MEAINDIWLKTQTLVKSLIRKRKEAIICFYLDNSKPIINPLLEIFASKIFESNLVNKVRLKFIVHNYFIAMNRLGWIVSNAPINFQEVLIPMKLNLWLISTGYDTVLKKLIATNGYVRKIVDKNTKIQSVLIPNFELNNHIRRDFDYYMSKEENFEYLPDIDIENIGVLLPKLKYLTLSMVPHKYLSQLLQSDKGFLSNLNKHIIFLKTFVPLLEEITFEFMFFNKSENEALNTALRTWETNKLIHTTSMPKIRFLFFKKEGSKKQNFTELRISSESRLYLYLNRYSKTSKLRKLHKLDFKLIMQYLSGYVYLNQKI